MPVLSGRQIPWTCICAKMESSMHKNKKKRITESITSERMCFSRTINKVEKCGLEFFAIYHQPKNTDAFIPKVGRKCIQIILLIDIVGILFFSFNHIKGLHRFIRHFNDLTPDQLSLCIVVVYSWASRKRKVVASILWEIVSVWVRKTTPWKHLFQIFFFETASRPPPNNEAWMATTEDPAVYNERSLIIVAECRFLVDSLFFEFSVLYWTQWSGKNNDQEKRLRTSWNASRIFGRMAHAPFYSFRSSLQEHHVLTPHFNHESNA